MERWSSSLIYPLTACALGVAAAFAFAAVSAPIWACFAIGLSTAVGALALRNWWIGEEERPLLAEELTGLHDAIDALRAESQELRDLMSEAVEMAEYRISEDAGAPDAGEGRFGLGSELGRIDAERRAEEAAREAARAARNEALLKEARRANAEQEAQIVRLEERIAALETAARATAAPSETPFLDRFEARLDANDARTRKLVEALSIAIEATRRHSEALRRLDGAAASKPEGPAPADPPEAPIGRAPDPDLGFAGSDDRTRPRDDAPPTSSDPAATSTPRPDAAADRPPEADPAPPPLRATFETAFADPSAASPEAAGGSAADAVLRVQPIFRAGTRQLRLLEVLPDDETAADLAAGALLDRALGLAASFQRQEAKLGALFTISLAALRSEATLAPLLAQLRADPAIAPTLTPSIAHAEIADVTDQDFALMRRLADAGVRFALHDVDGAALDPERAAEAGVRFILLDAASVAEREAREPGALSRLTLRLAQRGVSLVLIGVDAPELEALASSEQGVLAQGAAFAPPRRIRFA